MFLPFSYIKMWISGGTSLKREKESSRKWGETPARLSKVGRKSPFLLLLQQGDRSRSANQNPESFISLAWYKKQKLPTQVSIYAHYQHETLLLPKGLNSWLENRRQRVTEVLCKPPSICKVLQNLPKAALILLLSLWLPLSFWLSLALDLTLSLSLCTRTREKRYN